MDSKGNWKWDVFAHLIHVQIVMGIASYISPAQDGITNTMVWDLSSHGQFTVQTTYMVLKERGLWMETLLPYLKAYLVVKRHGAYQSVYMDLETLTHALRDCPKAHKIWEVFVKEYASWGLAAGIWCSTMGHWFGTVLAIKKMVRDTKIIQSGNGEGYNNTEIEQVVTAELWAIYVGLQITWDRGFRKMILESNSRVIIGLINGDRVSVDRNYNPIMQIEGILRRDLEVTTIHVYKETNCVADWLANYGLTRDLLDRGSYVLEEPPSKTLSFVVL
uniref:RNase H type-1 domain-containing protein n=1 Tax=Salix viminalis TaxID=40686 RepID=A0A6N2K9V4_SALVM